MDTLRKILLINHEGIILRIHYLVTTEQCEGSFLEGWPWFFYNIIWELVKTQKWNKTWKPLSSHLLLGEKCPDSVVSSVLEKMSQNCLYASSFLFAYF